MKTLIGTRDEMVINRVGSRSARGRIERHSHRIAESRQSVGAIECARASARRVQTEALARTWSDLWRTRGKSRSRRAPHSTDDEGISDQESTIDAVAHGRDETKSRSSRAKGLVEERRVEREIANRALEVATSGCLGGSMEAPRDGKRVVKKRRVKEMDLGTARTRQEYAARARSRWRNLARSKNECWTRESEERSPRRGRGEGALWKGPRTVQVRPEGRRTWRPSRRSLDRTAGGLLEI